MGTHWAQFRALALKNFSLQIKRKGSTCCQIFIPLSISLIVGVLSAFVGQGSSYPYPSYTEWHNPGLDTYPSFVNISYTNPSDPSSLPVGVLSPYVNTENSGIMGKCPQTVYSYWNDNYTLLEYWRTPFLGNAFQSANDIDQYFYDRQTEVQGCTDYYECGRTTRNTSLAFYFRYFEAGPRVAMNFTVQAGNPFSLNNLGYYFGGDPVEYFLAFTSIVHSSMYGYVLNDNTSVIVPGYASMPYVEYYGTTVGNMFSLFMIPFAASFLFSVYMYTLVQEKKEGLVQKMHSCGIPMVTYWVVNYIYNLLLYLVIAAVLFAFGLGFGVEVFIKRPLETIVLLLLWGFAQVAMCQFLTCIIWVPTLASIVGFLLSIFGTLAGLALETFIFLQRPREMPNGFYLLYPGFAFYHGFGLIVYSRLDPNFGELTLAPGSNFSNILLILIAETVVLCFLTWYIEKIFPREIGVRRSPLFPFYTLINKFKKKNKSFGNDIPLSETTELLEEDRPKDDELPKETKNENEDEDVKREREFARKMDALVRIVELTKIYPGANGKEPKLALNHLSLRIQANECFGLLGPNGAGKTTLLSTLCGTIAPTSGVAFIDGLSINKNMEEIHKILGICPQFDVLWSELTVTEHLLFYLRVKNSLIANENAHVKEIIEEVGLEEVATRPASGLSGGQKRRLSIAIAMMGRPKLILMDEPTTGLDPSSRRSLWDIIVKAKERHSIVLSTHSMEEAEVLCNRIGIMRKARLHSVGTQMQLKNKFELGYNIKLSHFVNCHDKAHNFVMEIVPSAVLVRAYGDVRAYKVMKGDFVLSDLFKKMELNKYRYGIKEWSISQASLEEVFLAIVTEDESEEK